MIWLIKAFREIYKKRNYRKAIIYFRAILVNGSMAKMENVICLLLGQAYHWNKDIERAEATLLKALKLNIQKNRHDPQVYEFLGYVFLKKKEYKDALYYFDKAIQYSNKRKITKQLCYELNTPKLKEILEEHKDKLPFMAVYAKQRDNALINDR